MWTMFIILSKTLLAQIDMILAKFESGNFVLFGESEFYCTGDALQSVSLLGNSEQSWFWNFDY